MRTSVGQFFSLPHTKLGRQSVWLGSTFLLLFVLNVMVNIYVIAPFAVQQPLLAFYILFVISMLVCGLTGGIAGLRAVSKQHEGSSLVWLSILCGLFVLLLVLNELMQGIQYMLAGFSQSGN